MPEVFGHERRTARKRHTCAYCDGAIRPGTVYERWAFVDLGAASEVKTHPDCVEMWADIDPYPGDETPSDPHEFRTACAEAFPARAFPWELF